MKIKIEIEKGVPIPPVRLARRNYPFEKMKVGDSFIIKSTDAIESEKQRARIMTAYHYWRNKNDRKIHFVTRVVPDGVRCWRIE